MISSFRKREEDVAVISIADDQRHNLNHETTNVDGPETVQESPRTNNPRNMDPTEPPSSNKEESSTSTSTQVIIPSEDQTGESYKKEEVDAKDEEDTRDVDERAVFIESR